MAFRTEVNVTDARSPSTVTTGLSMPMVKYRRAPLSMSAKYSSRVCYLPLMWVKVASSDTI